MSDDGLPEDRGADDRHFEPVEDEQQRADATKFMGPGDFHNVEAEAALLGALMIDNRLAGDVTMRLKEDHFYEPLHARIYRTIVRLVANGKIATPVTLRPIFEHDQDMATLGGPAYLAQLTGSGAAIIGARDFAEQVTELARMRRLYEAMIATVNTFQNDGEIGPAVDKLEREIWLATDDYRPIKVYSTHQLMNLTQARIDRIQATPTAKEEGVHSRILPELNSLLGGLEPGEMTLLGGRPSMGKTTVAISWAWGAAANGHPGLYLAHEMTAEAMSLKVSTDISYTLGAPLEYKKVRKGLLSQADQRMFDVAKEKSNSLPLRWAEMAGKDLIQVESVVAREVAYRASLGQKLEFLVVDHIGLVQMEGEKDPHRRVSRISKALLAIAKKYGLHVVALAQLSRKVEDRLSTERRPQLSDLRDSGDLEQDADNVVFVHRPEFYLVDEKPKPTTDPKKAGLYEAQLKDWEIDMAEWGNKAELIGAKVRAGERASRRIRFYGAHSAARSLVQSSFDDDGEDLFMAGG